MKAAIMQPYLFPYIGYWQLIRAADVFVIYDDVNYIKGGWVNRNRVLLGKKEHLLTLKLYGASPNKLINEISIFGSRENRSDLRKTIKQCYTSAPQYKAVMPLLESIIYNKETNISRYIEFSLKEICNFLKIRTKFLVSSDLEKRPILKGQDKVLDIAKRLKAAEYVNPIGGLKLYDQDVFLKNGIRLFFLRTKEIGYRQFDNEFVPNLSIIDALMFNPRQKVAGLLNDYELTCQPSCSRGKINGKDLTF